MKYMATSITRYTCIVTFETFVKKSWLHKMIASKVRCVVCLDQLASELVFIAPPRLPVNDQLMILTHLI